MVRIVGVDCATDDGKVGVALAEELAGRVRVLEASVCSAESRAAAVIAKWLAVPGAGRALLALDAPLGWPAALGMSLSGHKAGAPIQVEPNTLFRRTTDRFVQARLKKTPLDVGADRIARTAHAALTLLHQLRAKLEIELPLVWDPDWKGIGAIEVYPAATLLGRGLPASGYKKKNHLAEREGLINSLQAHLQMPTDSRRLVTNADALDAAVCVLAGADFIRGAVEPPMDRELAEKEGWIWFAANAQ